MVVTKDKSMARPSSLKPAFRKERDDKGLAAWAVNVPSELSPTGKRQQLFFSTKIEAKAECEKLKARKANFGTSLALLSSTQITAAARACEMLAPYNLDLLEAVGAFLESHKQRMASVTFLQLCDQYIMAKSNRDDRHLKGLRNTRDRLPSLHSKFVSDIDHRTLEPLINKIVPGGRNLVLRHLKSFFNFAMKKGFATENPVNRLDFVETIRKEVEIIAPDGVLRMLEDALQNDLQLIPFLTLGFFTGIRPEEIRLMNWSDIDVPSRGITIRPEVSKTRKRRFPDLSENAVAWIESYRLAGGKVDGPITMLGEDALFAHRQKNRLAAGVSHWPNSAMRHSFCSYWLAKYKDVNRLVLLTGHDSPDTMWEHYHRGVTEAEAEKFWAIMPPVESENVIAFAQA
jgi:integrase